MVNTNEDPTELQPNNNMILAEHGANEPSVNANNTNMKGGRRYRKARKSHKKTHKKSHRRHRATRRR